MDERRTPLAQILVLFLAIGIVLLVLWLSRPQEQIMLFESSRNGHRGIYTLDISTGIETQLSDGISEDVHPVWSPDGQYIAFSSFRDGNYEIYLMDADGSNVRRITNDPSEDVYPTWSPDSTQLLFMRWVRIPEMETTVSQLHMVDVDEGNSRLVFGEKEDVWYPAWSPDGRQFAFLGYPTGTGQIHIADADGGNKKLIAPQQVDDKPVWSSDGRDIAFTSRSQQGGVEVFIVDVVSGEQRLLVQNNAENCCLAWSPDGKQILFNSIDSAGLQYRLYTVNIDDGSLRQLTDAATVVGLADWSSDGQQIVFVSYQDGNGEIYLINADGSHLRKLTSNRVDDNAPQWRP